MTLIYALLVAHFIADFLAQSDWMALNKSKRWDALAFHVAAYVPALWMVVGLAQAVGLWSPPEQARNLDGLMFLCVNGVAHFVQDAITSRITSRLWFFRQTNCGGSGRVPVPHFEFDGGSRHWFFVAIGADQLLHYLTLFITAGWWLQ